MGIFNVNFARRILSRSRARYRIGAALYHRGRDFSVKWSCLLRGIKYFPPIGPDAFYKSQFGQDRALELLGLLTPNGVFIEVGSNHPVNNSNSYYLEYVYGYHGISVDPVNYNDLFSLHRPRTDFVNAAIDSSKSVVKLNLVKKDDGWEDQMSSMHSAVISHGRGFQVEQLEVRAMPLAEVCKDLNHIDLLFLDVEGHELDVLKSLDWNRIRPAVVIAENNGQFYPRKRLEKFMAEKEYRLTARIGASDDIYKLESNAL